MVDSLTLRNYYERNGINYVYYNRQHSSNILLLFGNQIRKLVVKQISLSGKKIKRLKNILHLEYVEGELESQKVLNISKLQRNFQRRSNFQKNLRYLKLDLESKPNWGPQTREQYFMISDNRDNLAKALLCLTSLVCIELSLSCWGSMQMLPFFETLLESSQQNWPQIELVSLNIAKRPLYYEKTQPSGLRDDQIETIPQYYASLIKALSKGQANPLIKQSPQQLIFRVNFKLTQWPHPKYLQEDRYFQDLGQQFVHPYNNIDYNTMITAIKELDQELERGTKKICLSTRFAEKILPFNGKRPLQCVEIVPLIDVKWKQQ
ncbi:hypothetical protein FGO68_gene16201 [Halteria grandinella]|uniref:Uncharacterized protein n=1 Tax=Halteria grandinella TaxID=5974 RepID=A0A8J8NEM2_HALGN|nr:hypothetical protein FGO68_gene16201 [Halteria grandinella]